MAEDLQALLNRFDWPGNVRQLMNVLQNMVVVHDGDTLEPRHLPAEIARKLDAGASEGVGDAGSSASGAASSGGGALSLDQLEKRAIRDTLKATNGNREQAAKILGIGERTLYRKLKEYGLK